jgi:hypothetical protein
MTADERSTALNPQHADTGSTADEELRKVAARADAVINAWSLRMTEAAVAGRSATTVARMATARASAELRKIDLRPQVEGGPAAGDLHGTIQAYLKRLTATLARAAHEVERNRYSLEAMHAELERIKRQFAMLYPSGPESETQETTGGSVDTASGANDGSADRQIGPR